MNCPSFVSSFDLLTRATAQVRKFKTRAGYVPFRAHSYFPTGPTTAYSTR